jgi:hypothetical protein
MTSPNSISQYVPFSLTKEWGHQVAIRFPAAELAQLDKLVEKAKKEAEAAGYPRSYERHTRASVVRALVKAAAAAPSTKSSSSTKKKAKRKKSKAKKGARR